ncbi:fimbrial biogenesis chaperone [Vibrio campbellii]|uniref:fimbrial biogenesis chaperone n=1 Tax=Vibrio campbellii TaxID=680 RepID=UPI0002AE5B45|nr:molecular chaperone [Vibrio campbellii]ELU51264.1 Pili assembly chaperone [Vibrio campbellii CAIM 519 = NBRC 15631 = ATCC 25920]RDX38530.1 molecular chaperone [Vibrio campbellii]HDM8045885.1 molecular chaperone [Vibrio campbellii]
MKLNKINILCLILLIWIQVSDVCAGVVIGGTRVVFHGEKREESLSVTNNDTKPFLIQSWVDTSGETGNKKGTVKPPFLITPPLFRLDGGEENLVRIIRTGENFPENRESVYWVNVKSIPASVKGEKNVLQIAIKNRIKLFYRPEGIKRPNEEDFESVSFHRSVDQIEVKNPTPYYISFYSMKLGDTDVSTTHVMVPPQGSAYYHVPASIQGDKVTWQYINEFGGISKSLVYTMNKLK